ncbi:uncharacterized protein [Triticum aestivum]|uniref:Maf-like protein n=1 Tax=Aegilops tauschii TaxID=37682 RepID=M8BS02_AEGTA|nr:uncharacterized protein LOC123099513 [Triticum aestivum]
MASTCNNSSSFKSADIDEKAIRREKPEELVKALAEAKADAIQLNLRNRDSRDLPTLLITSDQVKVSKGMIRERPTSTEEAREFIKGYSGDVAFAVNYILVTNLSTGGRKGGWDIPEVKEGGMTCVAGGLRLMHPSSLPFIKELVRKFFQIAPTSKCRDGTAYPLHCSDFITVLVSAFVAQVGTMDSVRGLPKNLTEKLIRESLQETVEM